MDFNWKSSSISNKHQKMLLNTGVLRRLVSLCLVWLLLFQSTFNLQAIWLGRIPESKVDRNKWVYGENKPIRILAMLEFENLTTSRSKDFDGFKKSIPRAIAKKIEKVKKLKLAEKDFIPTFPTRDTAYKLIKLPINEVNKSKENQEKFQEILDYGKIVSLDKFYPNTNQVFIYAAKVEVPDWIKVTNTVTNQGTVQTNEDKVFTAVELIEKDLEEAKKKVKEFPLNTPTEQATNAATNDLVAAVDKVNKVEKDIFTSFTNFRVAYHITNEEKTEYWFYQFQQGENSYIDAELVAPYTNLFPPVKTDRNGLNYFYLNEKDQVDFRLDPKLYQKGSANWEDLLNVTDADYILYGNYKVVLDKMTVKMFMINVHHKTIAHFYTKNFPNYAVRKEIELMDTDILAYLQDRPIVENLTLDSDVTNAVLYLDDVYYGVIPQRISRIVAGDYKFEVKKSGYVNTSVISDLAITSNQITIDRDNGKVKFLFEDNARRGKLKINIANEIDGEFYLNNTLVGKGQNYEDILLAGDYFVKIEKTNYVTRSFKVPVEKNRTSEIYFDMEEVTPPTWWDEVFFDHNRNVKIFGVLGLVLMGGFIGVYAETVNYEDKRNEVDSRIVELTAANSSTGYLPTYKEELTDSYNTYLVASLSLLGSSVISFGLMLWSHFMDIWSYRAPIETEIDHAGDVKFVFKKDY